MTEEGLPASWLPRASPCPSRHGHGMEMARWPRWHANGMAAAWHRHGNGMGTAWERHGRGMATAWQRHGNVMAAAWRRHGGMAPAWRHGDGMARIGGLVGNGGMSWHRTLPCCCHAVAMRHAAMLWRCGHAAMLPCCSHAFAMLTPCSGHWMVSPTAHPCILHPPPSSIPLPPRSRLGPSCELRDSRPPGPPAAPLGGHALRRGGDRALCWRRATRCLDAQGGAPARRCEELDRADRDRGIARIAGWAGAESAYHQQPSGCSFSA